MTTMTISDTATAITVISTFTTEPARQNDLVAVLADQADRLLRDRDGFLSCAIHASQDRTRVVNYALWRDTAAIHAMLTDPAVRQHTAAIRGIATVDPVRYTIRHVCHAT